MPHRVQQGGHSGKLDCRICESGYPQQSNSFLASGRNATTWRRQRVTGGVQQSLDIAKLCRAEGVQFSSHTWTNGLGFIVNAPVFAASGFADEMVFEYPVTEPGLMPEALKD